MLAIAFSDETKKKLGFWPPKSKQQNITNGRQSFEQTLVMYVLYGDKQ